MLNLNYTDLNIWWIFSIYFSFKKIYFVSKMLLRSYFFLIAFVIYAVSSAKNPAKTKIILHGQPSFIVNFKCLETTIVDRSVATGNSYILNNRVFLNYTVFIDFYAVVHVLLRLRFKDKSRTFLNKTSNVCEVMNSKDLVFQHVVIPIIREAMPRFCPVKKVICVSRYIIYKIIFHIISLQNRVPLR